MADLNLTTRILGKEAMQFIRDLVAALGKLKQAAKDASTPESVRAAKAEAQALQQRLAAARQFLENKKQEANAIAAINKKMVQDAENTAAQLIATAKAQSAANRAAAEAARDAAREAASTTAASVSSVIANQKALVAAVEEGVRQRIQRQKDLDAFETQAAAKTIARLQNTLAQMRKERQQEAEVNRERISDAKKALDAAKAVAEASKPGPARRAAESVVDQRKQELAAAREQAKIDDQAAARRVANQQAIVTKEKQFAAEQAAARAASVAKIESAGKKEVSNAKANADVVIAQEEKKKKASDAAARSAEANIAKVDAANKKQEASAVRSGNAIVASAGKQARQENAAADARVRNANKSVNALDKQTAAAKKAASEQEKASQRAVKAQQAQVKVTQQLDSGLRTLRRTVTQLVAAYAGFRSLLGFINLGLKFNQTIESARLGIASLITAEADLINAQGRLLGGTEALAAAQGLAQKQLDKLRIAGIQTSATTEELVTTFQEAVGAGVSVGLTLDQIRKFSVSVAQAATAINLPMNQLQQETRSILQGTIDRNSRIAKALQLTNAQVNLAKQQNRLAEFLEEKFKAFNIAGVESVKTFSALKSNISDALSVFTGISVRPLFDQLRDAGQEALQRIFDFKTADIQENFRGLIEALKEVFRQIGQVFSFTIRAAVDRAEELSKWLRDNKEQVRQTAAAISTMVREFIEMVGAITRAIGEMLSFGGQVNTVVGIARTLSALFQTIAENVKLIVGLLTARALLSTIGSIVAAVGALRTVAAGAGVGSVLGPVGTAIGGTIGLVIALRTAYKLLKGDAQAARLESARLGNAMVEQQLRGADLINTLIDLDRTIAAMQKTNEDTTQAEQQRAQIEEELRALGPAYASAIDSGTGSLEDRRKKLIEVIQQQRIFAAFQLAAAQAEKKQLEAERAKVAAQEAPTQVRVLPGGLTELVKDENAKKSALKRIDDQLDVSTQKVETLSAAYQDLAKAFTDATSAPARVKRRPEPIDPNAGEAPVIREAKARFEAMKAELDLQRAKVDQLFAQRMITAQQHLQRLLDIDLQEIEGERGLIQAQIDEAERKKKIAENKGKQGTEEVKAQEDQLRALAVELTGLDAKVIRLKTQFQTDLLQSDEETAQKRLEIEQRFLAASGQQLEAARLEILRKQEKAIRDAVREFGDEALKANVADIAPGDLQGLQKVIDDFQRQHPDSLVVKLAFAVNQETLQEQLEAAEKQIQQVEEQRNREVEGIKAHFKSLGKLSSDQQQQQADAISAANARASDSIERLRTFLLQLQQQATDPVMISFIDTLLARLDLLKNQAKDVNLEMQRLTTGIRESLEGAFSTFFQSIGAGADQSKNAFREMVTSIINDLRRLISQLIATRIAGAISTALGFAGAKSGGQALTVLQGRAEGGLGRPPHGVLHGGIQGKDSIPIAAMPEEYFMRRQATKHYGSDLFDLFNEMRVPVSWARELFTLMHHHFTPPVLRDRPRFNFAQGGAVGRTASSARPNIGSQNATITVDADGLLRFLAGNKGREITLTHVGSAPRFVSKRISKHLKRA